MENSTKKILIVILIILIILGVITFFMWYNKNKKDQDAGLFYSSPSVAYFSSPESLVIIDSNNKSKTVNCANVDSELTTAINAINADNNKLKITLLAQFENEYKATLEKLTDFYVLCEALFTRNDALKNEFIALHTTKLASVKLVENKQIATLCLNFFKDIQSQGTAPTAAINSLKTSVMRQYDESFKSAGPKNINILTPTLTRGNYKDKNVAMVWPFYNSNLKVNNNSYYHSEFNNDYQHFLNFVNSVYDIYFSGEDSCYDKLVEMTQLMDVSGKLSVAINDASLGVEKAEQIRKDTTAAYDKIKASLI